MRTSTTLTIVVLVLAASIAARGVPMDAGTPASIGGIRFAADVAVVPSADGEGAVRISYAVMYDALQFLRHGDGYRARYEVTAILYDKEDRQVIGDSWCQSVVVATYDETNARRTAGSDELEFSVEPGRYRLKLELTGLDTGASGMIEREVTVSRMVPGELSLGTVVFETGRAGRGEGAAEPALNPSRVYGEDRPDARVRIPVYGTPDSRYAVEITVRDDRGLLSKSHEDTLVQGSFLREYVYEFTVLDVEVGAYVLEVRLTPLPEGEEVRSRSRFRVVTSPMSWGQDEEKMLAQISHVATRDELDFLSSVPPEERGPVWDEFWAGRDPNPATEVNEFKAEFLRRLGHANAQFRSIIEGWQTDMGRIYIQHGDPDDIDVQGIGQMLSAWEIWYYYRDHTKYIFVDEEGFGEFVLQEISRI